MKGNEMEPAQVAGKIFRGDPSTAAQEVLEVGMPIIDFPTVRLQATDFQSVKLDFSPEIVQSY